MIKLDDKIILRKPEHQDTADLLEVKNNKTAAALLGGYRERDYTEEDIHKWIDFHNNNTDEIIYVIYDIAMDRVVGHVGFYNIDRRIRKAEFAILIGNDACRGRGYGSLCLNYFIEMGFDNLNLNRIELTLLKENNTAMKLYERFGFVVEGIQKQAQFKNGRYYDVVLMALLRENYAK